MSRYEEVMQRYDALWSAVDFMYNENVYQESGGRVPDQ